MASQVELTKIYHPVQKFKHLFIEYNVKTVLIFMDIVVPGNSHALFGIAAKTHSTRQSVSPCVVISDPPNKHQPRDMP